MTQGLGSLGGIDPSVLAYAQQLQAQQAQGGLASVAQPQPQAHTTTPFMTPGTPQGPLASAPPAPPPAYKAVPYDRGDSATPATPGPLSVGPNNGPQALPNLGAPRMVGKAGFVPSSESTQTSEQKGIQLSPTTQAAIGSMDQASQDELNAALSLNAQQSPVDAKQQQVMALKGQVDQTADELRRAHAQSQLMDYRSKVDGLMKEASDASHIDDKKFFADQSTGDRIKTGMIAALKGFNFGWQSAFGHAGGESGTDWIENQVKENVARQQQNYMNKKGSAEEAQTLYGKMREAFGDDDRAALATELGQRQALMTQMQAVSNDQQAPAQERLRAATLVKTWAATQAQTHQKLDEITADKISQSTANAAQYHQAQVFDPLAAQTARIKAITANLQARGVLQQVQEGKGSPEDQKLWAETQKTAADAQKTRAEAAGTSPQQVGDIQKQFTADDLPSALKMLDSADSLVKKGAASGSLSTLGIPPQIGLMGGREGAINGMLVGPDARDLHNTVTALATTMAKAQGQRGNPAAVEQNVSTILGNGTRERHRTRARSGALGDSIGGERYHGGGDASGGWHVHEATSGRGRDPP